MKYLIFALTFSFLFTACTETKKVKSLNPELLLKNKCSSCHNIEFPPKNFENEKAPSIMSISFHFNDWFQESSTSDKLAKQISFVSSYVVNPSKEEAFCTSDMLDKYGLMPSLKGKITQDEIKSISQYIFTTYTQEKLLIKQNNLQRLHSLPIAEQIAIKYNCFSCHRKKTDLVGPSFFNIGEKYKNNNEHIYRSILKGSKNIWKNSHGATMPSYKNISKKEITELTQWIINEPK